MRKIDIDVRIYDHEEGVPWPGLNSQDRIMVMDIDGLSDKDIEQIALSATKQMTRELLGAKTPLNEGGR